jgi:hypothetical protein
MAFRGNFCSFSLYKLKVNPEGPSCAKMKNNVPSGFLFFFFVPDYFMMNNVRKCHPEGSFNCPECQTYSLADAKRGLRQL